MSYEENVRHILTRIPNSRFKLNLIKGKTIIFVGDVDRSYRVKLFLEQFAVKAIVLNSELPLASRTHIVESFNKTFFFKDEGG